MMASYNQKYALIELSQRYQFPKIEQKLRDADITNQPMSVDRYKQIRNAICYNEPIKALTLLLPYTQEIKYELVDIDPTGFYN